MIVFDASVEISQAIYSGGSINAKIGIARKEFSMSRLMKDEALSSQILRANEVYLKATTSSILYNYGQNILNEAIPFMEKVRDRVNLGISDPIQLAVFAIKFNNLESKVQILRTNKNRDVGVYEYFFKTKFTNEAFPEVLIPPLSMDYNRKAYEVENSILNYESKREETRLTRSEFLPQFGFRTRYTEYDIDDNEGEDSDIRGGIYFSMPVFTFGRASAKISSSKAKERAFKMNIDIERKSDDTLETEIVTLIDSSVNTRKEIFKAYNDTRKQSSIIRDRLEITNFSPDAYVDSALEELNQLERFLATETSLLHGYMLYKHQNRELTSLIRISQ
ncbi:MAG: TolC family protein [Alphaproteobacteria bacterium]